MDSTQSPDTFKKLNVQLGESTKKMNILISDAAKAGATMENDFKRVFMTVKKLLILYQKKLSNRKISYVRHRMMFQCLLRNIRN